MAGPGLGAVRGCWPGCSGPRGGRGPTSLSARRGSAHKSATGPAVCQPHRTYVARLLPEWRSRAFRHTLPWPGPARTRLPPAPCMARQPERAVAPAARKNHADSPFSLVSSARDRKNESIGIRWPRGPLPSAWSLSMPERWSCPGSAGSHRHGSAATASPVLQPRPTGIDVLRCRISVSMLA